MKEKTKTDSMREQDDDGFVRAQRSDRTSNVHTLHMVMTTKKTCFFFRSLTLCTSFILWCSLSCWDGFIFTLLRLVSIYSYFFSYKLGLNETLASNTIWLREKNSMCLFLGLFPQKIEHFLFCEDFHFLWPFNVHSESSFSFFLPFTVILSQYFFTIYNHSESVSWALGAIMYISYYDLIILLQHNCLFNSKVVSLMKVERHKKIGCVIIYWCITNYIAYSNRLFMLMIDCLRIWCRIPIQKFVRLALQIIIFFFKFSFSIDIRICSTKSKSF